MMSEYDINYALWQQAIKRWQKALSYWRQLPISMIFEEEYERRRELVVDAANQVRDAYYRMAAKE